MYRLLIIVFITCLPFTLHAALSEYKSAFIERCTSDGEVKAVCTCSFNRFTQSLAASEQGSAEQLLAMMTGGQQPMPQQMMAMQPMIMKLQKSGMACAAQTDYVEQEESVDFNALMGGGLSAEQAQMLNGIANGQGDVMAQMQAMDRADQQQRQDKKAARRAQQQKEAQAQQQYREAYKSEKYKLLQSSVLSLPVSRFKKGFELKHKSIGHSDLKVACLWRAVEASSGTGKPASLMAYFAMLGGNDFDQEAEHRPYLKAANQRYQNYQNNSGPCYN